MPSSRAIITKAFHPANPLANVASIADTVIPSCKSILQQEFDQNTVSHNTTNKKLHPTPSAVRRTYLVLFTPAIPCSTLAAPKAKAMMTLNTLCNGTVPSQTTCKTNRRTHSRRKENQPADPPFGGYKAIGCLCSCSGSKTTRKVDCEPVNGATALSVGPSSNHCPHNSLT